MNRGEPDFDALVVGAGVVGLAAARSLALQGWSVLAVEAEAQYGAHASSRSSEVIHAGLYYTPGSLKARLCVRGRDLLYRYCAERGIPHRRLGKLIVAPRENQLDVLNALQTRAAANGVTLQWRTAREVQQVEPAVSCQAALWSPLSGIVDSHGLMVSLLGDLESASGTLVLNTPFEGATWDRGLWRVRLGGTEPSQVGVRSLVNAAGLRAPSVAAQIDGLPQQLALPAERYCKGHYYALSGRSPFSRLVYPLPDSHGLGVHATLDFAGQVRFGPDASIWPSHIDYGFELSLRDRDVFAAAIREYFPALDTARLAPAYTGLRAKISGPLEPAADFRIDGPGQHGLPGLVNLLGIESPGLTACLAIGEEVLARLEETST